MKRIMTILAVLIMVGLVTSSIVLATSIPLRIVVNGERVFPPDAQPFIDSSSRTQVPLRFVSEALGAYVNWDSKNKKVTVKLDNKNVVLYVGKNEFEVNGVKKQMDTKALIKDSRTFVPIRFVSEALGARVKWEASIRTVYINTDGTTPSAETDEIKVTEVHGFTVHYKEMGQSSYRVFVTESRLSITEFENKGKEYPILDLGISFTHKNANPAEAANEVEAILRQKIDDNVVEAIMEYVRSKTTREDILPVKYFSDSKYKIRVISDRNISIYIYLK